MWSKVAEYGLVGAMTSVVLFILYRMIVWVMDFVKEQTTQHAAERIGWQEIMRGIQGQLRENILISRAFNDSVAEAHRFQREEHKEMIKSLGRINGYKET